MRIELLITMSGNNKVRAVDGHCLGSLVHVPVMSSYWTLLDSLLTQFTHSTLKKTVRDFGLKQSG